MRLQELWNDFSVDFAQKKLACTNLSSQDQGSLLSKSMMIPWIGIGTMPSQAPGPVNQRGPLVPFVVIFQLFQGDFSFQHWNLFPANSSFEWIPVERLSQDCDHCRLSDSG